MRYLNINKKHLPLKAHYFLFDAGEYILFYTLTSLLFLYTHHVKLKYYIHFFFFFHHHFPGNSPINPFLSTIAKQRGYSPLIVGDMFTILLLMNTVVKPLTGFVTDKYKCRKLVFLGAILLNGLLSGGMYLVPGATSSIGQIPDNKVVGSVMFWLFDITITVRMVLFMVAEVLQETIIMTVVGKQKPKPIPFC